MRSLAFSLRDVKICFMVCNQHAFDTASLALRDFEKLKGVGFFLSLIASMFLYFRGNIHQGHKLSQSVP